MSHIFSMHPIVAAFEKADDFITGVVAEENRGQHQPTPLDWRALPNSPLQEILLEGNLWDAALEVFDYLKPNEMDSIAHWDAAIINKWLANHGYNISLAPWSQNRETFGFAGHVKFEVQWISPGRHGHYILNDKSAFRLDTNTHKLSFYQGEHGVTVRIPTSNPDWTITISPLNDPTLKYFDLLEYALDSFTNGIAVNGYSGAILPHWDLKQVDVDLNWCKGISTSDVANNTWRITQALMQGSSSFGAWGAAFKAAAAFAATRELAMKAPDHPNMDLVVDYDLVCAFWHKESAIPLGVVSMTADEFSREKVSPPEEK